MEGKTHYRKILTIAIVAANTIMLCGCGAKSKTEEAKKPETVIEFETPEVTVGTPEPAKDAEPERTPEPAEQSGREDGERFEEIIMLEGMEETVKYEHARNTALGFEIDYDYESLERQKEADRERFVSIYDDPKDPWNYLDVMYLPESTDSAEASITAELSETYEVIRENRSLENAGPCVVLDASAEKGGNTMPDRLQTVYIIPAGSGSIIARANYAAEAAEGFGSRFSYMLDTLSVIRQD